MEHERDRNQAELAGRLRETGVAPERDLWPEIAAKIGGSVGGTVGGADGGDPVDDVQRRTGVERPDIPVVHGPPVGRRRSVAARVALAAVLTAALIWGAFRLLPSPRDGLRSPADYAGDAPVATPVAGGDVPAAGPRTATGELAIIDAALAEIKEALTLDPGNSRLYRSLQRIQQSRGSVLCKLARH